MILLIETRKEWHSEIDVLPVQMEKLNLLPMENVASLKEMLQFVTQIIEKVELAQENWTLFVEVSILWEEQIKLSQLDVLLVLLKVLVASEKVLVIKASENDKKTN